MRKLRRLLHHKTINTMIVVFVSTKLRLFGVMQAVFVEEEPLSFQCIKLFLKTSNPDGWDYGGAGYRSTESQPYGDWITMQKAGHLVLASRLSMLCFVHLCF